MSYSSTQSWPARAVVTAGMPYGNKALHFGHVAGVFVPADAYARFLRDRIGDENVLFVSGTDCFGSPIEEGYREACELRGFKGDISDYVRRNHDAQKATLDAYKISLSIYEGSGLGRAGEVHQLVTNDILERLHDSGHLHLASTLQFYDSKADKFLNGRQVVGRCPVEGCKSDKAYADECDLGHQFAPQELIAPKSTLTGETPDMRPVENWYFDLPCFRDRLCDLVDEMKSDPELRFVVWRTIEEFLGAPVIFIKNEFEDSYRALEAKLPAHTFHEAERGKRSFGIEFSCIEDRDAARDLLSRAGVRFRTGKALVPFRISGNVEWGVKVPQMEGTEGLTVWCWPESLWAPVSFTATALEARGGALSDVREWWCSPDACVYQFIGQDNLYFYGVAQPALWMALEEGAGIKTKPDEDVLQQTRLIANHHILFGKTKASSSGVLKPPSADELLNHYTAEQLRAHWLALGLDQKSVGFKPKPFDPNEKTRTDPRVADPALKEGALLTNVFNRLARSCFYEAQKNFEGFMPLGAPDESVVRRAHDALGAYEAIMHKAEFHSALSCADDFIRWAQKGWVEGIKAAEKGGDDAQRRQVLLNSFFTLRVSALLMHPIAPVGCEMIAEYLRIAPERIFNWNVPFDSMDELCAPEEVAAGRHALKTLPPRTDFFAKHPSQFKG